MKALWTILLIIIMLPFIICEEDDWSEYVAVLSSGDSYSITGGGKDMTCGLEMDAMLEGASWDRAGSESVRIRIKLSSGEEYTGILYGGEILTRYRYNLYQVQPGTKVTVAYDEVFSRTQQAILNIKHIQLECSDDPEMALARKLAPILQNRQDVDYNDVPLQMIYDPSYNENGQLSKMKYTLIYSHEDGGSGLFPMYLFGSNGRLTDVQSILWINDPYLEHPEIIYEGAIPVLHTKTPFDGQFIYGRPALRISTTNGLLTHELEDSSTNPFISPDFIIAGDPEEWYSRELVHKYIDGVYRVMAQEAFREGTSVANETPTPALIGDLRKYLIVIYRVNGTGIFQVLNADGQLLGQSKELSDDNGGIPIWINEFAGDTSLSLYWDGEESSLEWFAAGYHEDLLEPVNIAEECLDGTIKNAMNPCLLWK